MDIDVPITCGGSLHSCLYLHAFHMVATYGVTAPGVLPEGDPSIVVCIYTFFVSWPLRNDCSEFCPVYFHFSITKYTLNIKC